MNCVDVDDCVVVVVMNINSIHKPQIKSNQESNTFFHISSNEGRECASETIHACARLKYDCGHPDSIPGRTVLWCFVDLECIDLFWENVNI